MAREPQPYASRSREQIVLSPFSLARRVPQPYPSRRRRENLMNERSRSPPSRRALPTSSRMCDWHRSRMSFYFARPHKHKTANGHRKENKLNYTVHEEANAGGRWKLYQTLSTTVINECYVGKIQNIWNLSILSDWARTRASKLNSQWRACAPFLYVGC